VDRRTSGLVIAVLAFLFVMPRPEPTSAQGTNTVEALLIEVRGLRAALEQLASAGPRVQLLFGRLQLQEQRVAGHLRRLETLRDRMRDADREVQNLTDEISRLESNLKTNTNEGERQVLEQHLAMLRREVLRATAARETLRGEEAGINSEIATEQGRWADINQRLEELERALARR
jgi:chromosome segregation ATPase